jgi:hypothetical protein
LTPPILAKTGVKEMSEMMTIIKSKTFQEFDIHANGSKSRCAIKFAMISKVKRMVKVKSISSNLCINQVKYHLLPGLMEELDKLAELV